MCNCSPDLDVMWGNKELFWLTWGPNSAWVKNACVGESATIWPAVWDKAPPITVLLIVDKKELPVIFTAPTFNLAATPNITPWELTSFTLPGKTAGNCLSSKNTSIPGWFTS